MILFYQFKWHYSQEKMGESFVFHKHHSIVPAFRQNVPLKRSLSGEHGIWENVK